MCQLCTLPMSFPDNSKFIQSKSGGLPTLILVGRPSTGKTTAAQYISRLLGIEGEKSVLHVNRFTLSSVISLTSTFPGIPIMYVIISKKHLTTYIHLFKITLYKI